MKPNLNAKTINKLYSDYYNLTNQLILLTVLITAHSLNSLSLPCGQSLCLHVIFSFSLVILYTSLQVHAMHLGLRIHVSYFISTAVECVCIKASILTKFVWQLLYIGYLL